MVKQYVGARYVPKFATPVEWAADTSYEALTIVTFNNASYTSKIQVPPTVGNPANNPKYWVLTGNYNAQVEEYRQETTALKNTTNELDDKVEECRQETTALKNTTNELDDKIANVKSELETQHYMVVIGDSFSNDAQSGTPLWYTYVAEQKNLQVYTNASDGMGFIVGGDNNFSAQLNKAHAALTGKKVDVIYILGGLNDMNAGHAANEIGNAVGSVIRAAKNLFPNTKIEIYGPENFPSILKASADVATFMNYQCGLYGVEYHNIAMTFNLFPGFFGGKDGNNVHPSAFGESVIAQCILQHGNISCYAYVPDNMPLVTQDVIKIGGVTVPDNNIQKFAFKEAGNAWHFNYVITGFNGIPSSGTINIKLPANMYPFPLSNSSSTTVVGEASQLYDNIIVSGYVNGNNEVLFNSSNSSTALVFSENMSAIRIKIDVFDR